MDVQKLSRSLGKAAESIKVRYMGLGFILAWIYCLWFSGSVLSESMRSSFATLLPSMAGSGIVLLAMALRPGEKKTPGDRWTVLSPAIMSATTLMLFLVEVEPVAIVCSLLGGIASAFLWVQWGDQLCKLEQETLENNMSGLALVTVAIAAVVSNLPHVLAGISVAAMPILSGAMLLICKGSHNSDICAIEETPVQTQAGRSSSLIPIVLCSAVCAAASSFAICTAGPANSYIFGSNVILAFIGGGPLAVLLLFATLAFANRIDFSFLYRWLVPLLVISLACMSMNNPAIGTAGILLAGSVAFMTDCIFVIVFVKMFRLGICAPVESFGLFRAGVQLGASLGVALGAALLNSDIPLLGGYQLFICICVFIPIAVVMFDQRIEVKSAPIPEAAPQPKTEAEVDPEAVLDTTLAEKYRLSPREREVLSLFARGRSVPYIRETLCISKNTIETHLKHAYTKMGVHSKQELLDLLDKERTGI